jgi:hypothetical protein
VAVEEHPKQDRLTKYFDAPFLGQLSPQRVEEALTGFDTAAGQMPACDIAVLDQKHAITAVHHDAANPQRHAPGEAPVQMETPPQQRLEPLSQGLKIHRALIPAFPQIVIDPCIAQARLPLPFQDTGYHDMPWLTGSPRPLGWM